MSRLRHRGPEWLAVLASLALSLLAWTWAGVPNDDGILYLLTAEAFQSGGWPAAFEAYGWPFYSVLLAGLNALGLPLEAGGQLLNLASFALMAWAFPAIVRELYPERPAWAWLALPLILLLPELNAQRAMLIRDNGYLAFWLLSLWLLLRLARRPGWGLCLAWLGSLLLAFSFRLEAAVFGVAGALALCLAPPTRRHGLACLTGLALAFPLAAAWLPASRLADFAAWWLELRQAAPAQFAASSARLGEAVLNQYSRGFEREAYLAVLMTLLIGKLLKAWTPVHALLLWLGRAGLRDRGMPAAWRAYALTALMLPLVFVLFRQFLSLRFVLPLALCLLLLAPPALAALAARWSAHPLLLRGLALFLALLFLGGSLRQFRGDDTVLREAGLWLRTRPGTLWTNHAALSYYAGQGSPALHVGTAWRDWRQQEAAARQASLRALVVGGREHDDAARFLAAVGGRELRRYARGKYLIIVTARE